MDIPLQTPAQLGIHLRSRRRALGLTQTEVAAAMGLSQKRLSRLELNPGRFTAEQLLTVLAILKMDVVLRERGAPAARANTAAEPTAPEW